jgi:hypothetical protein
MTMAKLAIERGGLVARLAVAGVLVVSAAGVAAWHFQRSVGTPASVFQKCVSRFTAGRLAVDDSDAQRCGQARLEPEVARLGQARFQEVYDIFARAEQLGADQLQEVINRSRSTGFSAFAALPRRERERVAGASRRQYVLESGLGVMTPQERALLPNVAAFDDASARAAAALSLGEAALPDTVRSRVAGKTDAELAGDPELAPFTYVRSEAGAAALAQVESNVWGAGEGAWRSLPRDERRRIEQQSTNAFVVETALASLSPADREVIGDGSVLMDNATFGMLAFRAGRARLSAEERAQLPDGDRQTFVLGRDAYVDREGRRILGLWLRTALGRLRPALGEGAWSGTLLAWNVRHAAVSWGTKEVSDLFGSRAMFTRTGDSWRLDWIGEVGAGSNLEGGQ